MKTQGLDFTNMTVIAWYEYPERCMKIRLRCGTVIKTTRPSVSLQWGFKNRGEFMVEEQRLWDRRMRELWDDLRAAAYEGADWPPEYRPRCEPAAAHDELSSNGAFDTFRKWTHSARSAAMDYIWHQLSQAEKLDDDHEETVNRLKAEIKAMHEEDFK